MNFEIHVRQLFQIRGRASVYTPPVGSAVSCKAIRQGGGQSLQVGPIRVVPERTRFHVRRTDIPAPAPGAALVWDGVSFTIDAFQPVERDADGLLWELDASWGVSIGYRSVTGSGLTQNPPVGEDYTVAANASAGASSVSITADFIQGRLNAGDRLTIAGNATTYTVQAPGAQAASDAFASVPISPVLAANAAAGAAVTFDFARDHAVRAAVADYMARDFQGAVKSGDRRLVVLQSALDAAGMTEAPASGDRVTFEAAPYNVESVKAIYQGSEPYAWELQIREA